MSKRTWRVVRSFAILLVILITLAALEVGSRLFLEGAAIEGTRREVIVTIPQGATLDEIAGILYNQNLIEHPRLFGLAARVVGVDTKLRAGTVKLALGQSLVDLIKSLSTAKAVGVPVTIREGLTGMQVAGILAHDLNVDSTAFLRAFRDSTLLRKLGVSAPSFEGYLFPDTYFFTGGESPEQIIERMVANLRVRLPEDTDQKLSELGLTLNELLALASIVEWECMIPSEAKVISSVYLNRLRRGMLLQADPTVAYALGKGPSRLFLSDLRVDSPYNTYKYQGLPPGAINSPGKRAIEAALHPAQTPYLFFVAQGDGTHAFTTTFGDHLQAKEKLDELRRAPVMEAEAGEQG
ncbi:MAG: endolytic transglycosylase MltG [Calditrichaeota bacterium]|nr:endolytic transglycosylase MltG [Calditrichota bacterium]MCB9366382.1 endolytic transglycosylase MltG [Calditrichota bacterium]MCB9391988.1 endolytic transglycosylase MltG [Calditrichota bacterium]